MTPTATRTPAVQTKRRGRPRKVESYSAWCARIDAEVEHMAREIGGETPPLYSALTEVQRRIVDLLISHLRRLPALAPGTTTREIADNPQYKVIWNFVWEALKIQRGETTDTLLKNASRSETREFLELLHNFGPVQTQRFTQEDDDE